MIAQSLGDISPDPMRGPIGPDSINSLSGQGVASGFFGGDGVSAAALRIDS
jgi:hypothetical protein